MYSPQAIQDVDEFVSSSDLEKCSIISVAHQWMLCSEWVPSEWESKQLLKHHNIHSNPHHSSPSVNVLWSKKICVCKKQIYHLDVLKLSLWLKWESIIHNNHSPMKKVASSESGKKYAQIKHHLQVKTVQNNSNKYVSGFWCERQQKIGFLTGGSFIIMASYFGQKRWLKLKMS